MPLLYPKDLDKHKRNVPLVINQGHTCILLLANLEAKEGLNGEVRERSKTSL